MENMRYFRIAVDTEIVKSTPESKLWCAVLKRALDDVNHYEPDHKYYYHAIEWLTVPGDENVSGTLAHVLTHITDSEDLQQTIIREVQSLVFDKKKLADYKTACTLTKYGYVKNKPTKTNAP